MITDADLRTLLADREVPAGISPADARRRAHTLRVRRWAVTAAAAAVLVPAVVAVAGAVRLPGSGTGAESLPQAFAGDGRALPLTDGGVVTLDVPHLSAWADSKSLCVGDWDGRAAMVKDDLPSPCLVTAAAVGVQVRGGAIASFSDVPVARADFTLGNETEHAQVTGFALHPRWRLLTARWHGAESDAANVLIRGWDADGKLVLSIGCGERCPTAASASEPATAPRATAAVPAATSSRSAP